MYPYILVIKLPKEYYETVEENNIKTKIPLTTVKASLYIILLFSKFNFLLPQTAPRLIHYNYLRIDSSHIQPF